MAGLALAAVALGAFNLVCTGTQYMDGSKKGKAYEITYRVSLDEGKWCENSCSKISEFASLEDNRISFNNERIDTPRERRISNIWVSRVTGEYRHFYRSLYGFFEIKGQCEKADFTGFPTYKTKF